MKKNQLFLSLLLLVFGLFISSCSEDNEPILPNEKEVTYRVLFTINELSNDLLNISDVNLIYIDTEGVSQSESILEYPFNKEIKGYRQGSTPTFIISCQRNSEELTQEKYDVIIDGKIKSVNEIDGGIVSKGISVHSTGVVNERIEEYLERISKRVYSVECK